MLKTIKKDGKKVEVSIPCKAQQEGDDYIVFLVDKNGTVATDSHNDRYNYPSSSETISLRTYIHACSDVDERIYDAIHKAGGKVDMKSSSTIASSLAGFLYDADLVTITDGNKSLDDDGYGPYNEYSDSQFDNDIDMCRQTWLDEIGCWLSPDDYRNAPDRE